MCSLIWRLEIIAISTEMAQTPTLGPHLSEETMPVPVKSLPLCPQALWNTVTQETSRADKQRRPHHWTCRSWSISCSQHPSTRKGEAWERGVRGPSSEERRSASVSVWGFPSPLSDNKGNSWNLSAVSPNSSSLCLQLCSFQKPVLLEPEVILHEWDSVLKKIKLILLLPK